MKHLFNHELLTETGLRYCNICKQAEIELTEECPGRPSRQLEPRVMPKITDIIEECAKIAELYEPDEKQDYITYASRDIRKLKLKYR